MRDDSLSIRRPDDQRQSTLSISRRSYLKSSLVGAASVAAVFAETGTARAASGYGSGGFGEAGYGGTGDDAPVALTTLSPAELSKSSATLDASLDDLGGASAADCSFEYRESGADTWTRTGVTTLSSPGRFQATVTGLASGTAFDCRARAEASDGDASEGDVVSFTTDGGDSPPTVGRFDVSEAGSPNPHAEITADWRVGDDDGDLDGVVIDVTEDASGSVVDSRRRDASGTEATGTEKFKIKHADGGTFDVTLTVADAAGDTASETKTVTE